MTGYRTTSLGNQWQRYQATIVFHVRWQAIDYTKSMFKTPVEVKWTGYKERDKKQYLRGKQT